jgi:hypothetical protein
MPKSQKTRHDYRHTKTELNRNRAEQFGGALTTRRLGPSDSPGASSSRARSTKSGADRQESVMAGRAGSGSSGGTGASRESNRAQGEQKREFKPRQKRSR